MGEFLNRDPEEMLRYVKAVKSYVSNMTMTMRSVEGVMDVCAKDLDDKSQECIARFHQVSATFLQQADAYHELARDMEIRANKLIQAREETRF